jgi:hypothetical protein
MVVVRSESVAAEYPDELADSADRGHLDHQIRVQDGHRGLEEAVHRALAGHGVGDQGQVAPQRAPKDEALRRAILQLGFRILVEGRATLPRSEQVRMERPLQLETPPPRPRGLPSVRDACVVIAFEAPVSPQSPAFRRLLLRLTSSIPPGMVSSSCSNTGLKGGMESGGA